MRTDKEQAIRLRQAGKSYQAIQQELGIPKGTLAGWFKNVSWSQDLKDRLSAEVSWANPQALKLMTQANRERWNLVLEGHKAAAAKEFQKLKNNGLFLAGIMLYWGEGEKKPRSSQVRLSNSDPEMIKMFYLFLTKVLKIQPDKIFAWLVLYPDLVDPVQKNFWSKATGLSPKQFKRSVYLKGKSSKKRLSFGVCTVTVNSRSLKERMLKWLELYRDYLRSKTLKLEE